MSEKSDLDIAADTLSGDLRDTMLTHMRSMQDPWSKLSEKAQNDKIYAITNACETVVRRAVAMIASRGLDKIFVKVPEFTVKDGIKAKLTAVQTVDNIELISANLNQPAILVFASPEEFLGQRAAATADKDQPEIPFDDDEEEDEGEERAAADRELSKKIEQPDASEVELPEADPSDAPEAA